MAAVDFLPHQGEMVQGRIGAGLAAGQSGHGLRTARFTSSTSCRRTSVATAHQVGRVVGGEDACNVRQRRRVHRGQPAARRHARTRRRDNRYGAVQRKQEESRSSAPAAPMCLPRQLVSEVTSKEGEARVTQEVTPSMAEGRVSGTVVEGPALGREEAAATTIQSGWRRGPTDRAGQTSIELGWTGERARRLGSITAHVSFLQYIFRQTRRLRPGCWRAGGLYGLMAALRWSRSFRCGGGANLASEAEFVEQRERAARVLDWYRQYVQLLRRLQSGCLHV